MEKEYPIDDEYCSIFKKSEELYPIYKVMEEKGYIINMRGELRLNTGERPEFINEDNFEGISELIMKYLQEIMTAHFGMQEKWLPSAKEEGIGNNIFISKDFYENKNKCLILIQGIGKVQPGIWSRKVCFNENLIDGSMLGHINEGIKHKYSLIILHPNKNEDSKTGGLLKGHEGMEEHCRTVWNELISQCPAKSLYIVAFSAGGPCLHSVYSGDREIFCSRVAAVAMCDTNFGYTPPEDQDWMEQHMVYFMTSKKPLGTRWLGPQTERMQNISCGHTEHGKVCASALPLIFHLFQENDEEKT